MIIIKRILFLFFIINLIVLNIYPVEDINNKIKICIIYDKTKYKNQIVNELEMKLNEKEITIYKDLIININKYDPDDYNAIIILSGVFIFTPNPLVTMYIKKHDYKKNIIYFCSTKYKESSYGFLDQNKIDTITSASSNNIKEITHRILDNLYKIINKEKKYEKN